MGARWRAADGRIIEIAKMDVDHARNCVSMLRKQGFCNVEEFISAFSFSTSLMGEAAQDAAERELSLLRPTRAIDLLERRIASATK